MAEVLEGFHGPGGWAEGMKLIGGSPALGVEWDSSAVATARAAGHNVAHEDVRNVDLSLFRHVRGVVMSPPCPGFSAAGKGLGRQDLPQILEMVAEWGAGAPLRRRWKDERSPLTLEVVRWLAGLEPEWVALEQVKEVLPVWQAIGAQLEARGYSVWTGLMQAERYGVPQTRTRAILIASRTRAVGEPPATHQRYYPPGHKMRDMPSLEEAILPRWVSMADALGWTTERDRQWVMRANAQSNAAVRGLDEPAPTIKGGHDFAERVWHPVGYERRQQSKNGVPAPMRPVDEPAPTIAGESRNDSWTFERPATTVQGDPRIWPPGHKVNADDIARGHEHYGDRAGSKAIRVSIEEAAVLQSFRPDYPWHGTKTKRFQQVGNAVPPLMAAAILAEATGVAAPRFERREPVDAEVD